MDFVMVAVMRLFCRRRFANSRRGTPLVSPARHAPLTPGTKWTNRVDQVSAISKVADGSDLTFQLDVTWQFSTLCAYVLPCFGEAFSSFCIKGVA